MANIAIVATGGVRAPTQLELADRFLKDGHEVRLFATRAALRFLCSHMLRRPNRIPGYIRRYRAASREFLAYFSERPSEVPHIAEAQWADVIVMAPASCNSIGKLVSGMCDNFPLLVVRALPRSKRVIVVPSMNHEMWFDPYFQRNVDLLNATEKYQVLSPGHGQMLSGDYGFGVQAPLERIVSAAYSAAGLVEPNVGAIIAGSALTIPSLQDNAAGVIENKGEILIVDRDQSLRQRLVLAIEQEYPEYQVCEFETATTALQWLQEHSPSLVMTELESASGANGYDLIEFCSRQGLGKNIHLIATSIKSRNQVGAEKLAYQDVLFLPKPLNVSFSVGMIAGCLGGRMRSVPATMRTLDADEVLFNQGDEGSEVFIVERGALRVLKQEGDHQIVLGTMYKGDMIGEIAFLTGSVRSATIVAAEKSQLVVLDLKHVRSHLERQPVWLQTMIESLVRHLLNSDRIIAATTITKEKTT